MAKIIDFVGHKLKHQEPAKPLANSTYELWTKDNNPNQTEFIEWPEILRGMKKAGLVEPKLVK